MAARRRRRSPTSRSTSTGTPRASASYAEVLPWDHLDSGLDKDWLWEDWQDALTEVEVDDCRWTPCFDCGVCPQMGTEIQVGPDRRDAAPAHRAELRSRPRPRAEPGRVSGTPTTIHERGRRALLAGRELPDQPPAPELVALGAVRWSATGRRCRRAARRCSPSRPPRRPAPATGSPAAAARLAPDGRPTSSR